MAEQGVTARFLPMLNMQKSPLRSNVDVDSARKMYRDIIQRLFKRFDKDGGHKGRETICAETIG